LTAPDAPGPDGPVQRALVRLRTLLAGLDEAQRERAVDVTRFEVKELENLFVLLLLGSFTGVPAPPSFIAAELLPHLEHEIAVLQARAKASGDALAEVVGLLDID